MRFVKTLILVIAVPALILPNDSFAHPGRTDAYGCHTCKINCADWGLSYGEYHCHQAKALPQPEEPVRSTRATSESPGYTTPAPEYKIPKTEVQNLENKPADSVEAKSEKKKKDSWLKRFFKLFF